jgi:hypothetical protein
MSPGLERIPAEAPISGPFWTIVVPIALFVLTFVSTWLLYRRFSRDGRG